MDDDTSTNVSRIFDVSRFSVALLNTGNYFLWTNNVYVFLCGKCIWEFVDGTTRPPRSDTEMKMYSRKSDMELATTLMTICASCKASVIKFRDRVKFWDKLLIIFHTVSESKIYSKLTILHQMRMEQTD